MFLAQHGRYQALSSSQKEVAKAMLAGDPLCSRMSSRVSFTTITDIHIAWSGLYRASVLGLGGTQAGFAACVGGRWQAPKQVYDWPEGLEDDSVVTGAACSPDHDPQKDLPSHQPRF